LGDLNYDGKVNSTDYLVLKRYLAWNNWQRINPNFLKAADLNRDGRVNSDRHVVNETLSSWHNNVFLVK